MYSTPQAPINVKPMSMPSFGEGGRSRHRDHLASVGAGAAAGVFSTIVVNPLDTLRVRLAASREATDTSSKSLLHNVRALFSNGFREGFSNGLLINLMASMPSNGIYLSSYKLLSEEAAVLGINHHVAPVLAAGGAVSATNVTLAPLFVLRTRVQIDPSKNFYQYARSILANEGLKGFYRGTATNIAGRVVEEATFWSVYEALKRATASSGFVVAGSKDNNTSSTSSSSGTHVGAGGISSFLRASAGVLGLSMAAKLLGTSIAYPYNVVMVHLREVDRATGRHQHTRMLPTVRHVYASDGVRGFYRGLSAHLMRSVMSKATQIYAFELAMSLYYVSYSSDSHGVQHRQGDDVATRK